MKAKKKGESKMGKNEIIKKEEIESLLEKTVKRHRHIFERLDEI